MSIVHQIHSTLMKPFIRFAIAGAAFLFVQAGLFAQTPEECIQQAVEIYSAMNEYQSVLTFENIDQSNIDDVKARMDKAVVLLDKAIREGNADQIKVARYFRNNFKYKYSDVVGLKGDNNYKTYDLMKEIERDFTSFTSSDFPLRYQFFGKNYVIKWENFGPTQAEYLTSYAEACYNVGKYEEAVRVNKQAMAHPNLTDWMRYVSSNTMCEIAEKDSRLLTVDEQVEFALKSILAYNNLNEKLKATVQQYDYPKVNRGAETLVRIAKTNPSQQTIRACADAAPIVVKHDQDNAYALELYELCYKNNYRGQAEWEQVAHDYAEVMYTKAKMREPQDFVYNRRVRAVGLTALDHQAAAVGYADCEAMKGIAAKYKSWDETAKESEYLKKSSTCLESRKKAQEKAEKDARRANRNFNLYLGADILPLLNTNPKRDYGAVVNFVFRKAAIEFGYKKINRNKENIFDLQINGVNEASRDNISRWDGFKMHFQPKFFMKNNNNGYFGIHLGYNEKNFDPMQVNVISDLDGAYSTETFQPLAKQYVGMLNFGGMMLSRGFGMEMHFGFGAGYNIFDPGNPIDRTLYTIENPLLENRKDSYWTPVLHAGFTMGLNLGPGRR